MACAKADLLCQGMLSIVSRGHQQRPTLERLQIRTLEAEAPQRGLFVATDMHPKAQSEGAVVQQQDTMEFALSHP